MIIFLLLLVFSWATYTQDTIIYPIDFCSYDNQDYLLLYELSDSPNLFLWNISTHTYQKALSAWQTPYWVTVLPDRKKGFSFYDQGRLRIKQFYKRSCQGIEWQQPCFIVSPPLWQTDQICYGTFNYACNKQGIYRSYQGIFDFILSDNNYVYTCPFLYHDALYVMRTDNKAQTQLMTAHISAFKNYEIDYSHIVPLSDDILQRVFPVVAQGRVAWLLVHAPDQICCAMYQEETRTMVWYHIQEHAGVWQWKVICRCAGFDQQIIACEPFSIVWYELLLRMQPYYHRSNNEYYYIDHNKDGSSSIMSFNVKSDASYIHRVVNNYIIGLVPYNNRLYYGSFLQDCLDIDNDTFIITPIRYINSHNDETLLTIPYIELR